MNTKSIVIAIVIIAVVGILFYVLIPRSSTPVVNAPAVPIATTSNPSTPTSTVAKPVPKSQPGTVAAITSAAMSTKLAASGASLQPKTVFSSTDPVIYAVLTVQNVTPYTELSYVRYFNGKYVDSKVSHPTQNGIKYFHFDWTLLSGKTHKTGSYTLNFYVNGKKAQNVKYVIR